MASLLVRIRTSYDSLVQACGRVDFIAPLLLRLYLAPVFWMAGWSKAMSFEDTVAWFGADGLGLPLPALMATLATGAELLGGLLLAIGLAVRPIAIPLMVTMLVAILSVHWPNGWLAVAEPQGLFANQRTMEAAERLSQIKAILREHGDYDYLTDKGSLVILNNGIEFGATYFLMLLSLFFTGAGRWFSVDYWIGSRLGPARTRQPASGTMAPSYVSSQIATRN